MEGNMTNELIKTKISITQANDMKLLGDIPYRFLYHYLEDDEIGRAHV